MRRQRIAEYRLGLMVCGYCCANEGALENWIMPTSANEIKQRRAVVTLTSSETEKFITVSGNYFDCNFRFRSVACASYASHALDTTAGDRFLPAAPVSAHRCGY